MMFLCWFCVLLQLPVICYSSYLNIILDSFQVRKPIRIVYSSESEDQDMVDFAEYPIVGEDNIGFSSFIADNDIAELDRLSKENGWAYFWLDEVALTMWSGLSVDRFCIRNEMILLTKSVENISSKLANINLGLDSNFYLVQMIDSENILVHETYAVIDKLKIQLVCRANISYPCFPDENHFERRSDLTGLHLTVLMENYPPLAWFDDTNLSVKPWGVFPEVFHELQVVMNFTYTLAMAPDRKFGVLQDDGTFNGMVGELQKGKADICIASMDIKEERAKVIDFSAPILNSEHRIFISVDGRKNDINYVNMLLIFSQKSMYVIMAVFATNAVTLFMIFTMHPEKDILLLDNMADSIAIPVRALITMRPSRDLKKIYSGRIVTLTILTSGFLIFAYFRSSLSSKLAVRSLSYPIERLEDILYTGYRLSTVFDTTSQDYFERAEPGSIQQLVWATMRNNLVENNDVGLDKITSEPNFAFFAYKTAGRASDLYPCHIVDVGPGYQKANDAISYVKNSSLTNLFDYHLLKMRQTGLIDFFKLKWMKDNSWKTHCETDTSKLSLGYLELFGVFLSFFGGIFMATILVISERFLSIVGIFPKRKKPNKRILFEQSVNHLIEILEAGNDQDYRDFQSSVRLTNLKSYLDRF